MTRLLTKKMRDSFNFCFRPRVVIHVNLYEIIATLRHFEKMEKQRILTLKRLVK